MEELQQLIDNKDIDGLRTFDYSKIKGPVMISYPDAIGIVMSSLNQCCIPSTPEAVDRFEYYAPLYSILNDMIKHNLILIPIIEYMFTSRTKNSYLLYDLIKLYDYCVANNHHNMIVLLKCYDDDVLQIYISKCQLVEQLQESTKDLEMYKSFYDHYHGWSVVTGQ